MRNGNLNLDDKVDRIGAAAPAPAPAPAPGPSVPEPQHRDKAVRWSPLGLFVSHRQAAAFWFSVSVVLAVLLVVSPYLTILAYGKHLMAIVVDPAKNWHVGHIELFAQKGSLQSEAAKMVAHVIFDRGPNGPTETEFAKAFFSADALKSVQEYWHATEGDFTEKNLRQAIEIDAVSVQPKRRKGGHAVWPVVMSGRSFRIGSEGDQPYSQTVQWELHFDLAQNPDFTKNQLTPLYVADMLPIAEREIEQEEAGGEEDGGKAKAAKAKSEEKDAEKSQPPQQQ